MQLQWTTGLKAVLAGTVISLAGASHAELVIIGHPGGPDSISLQQVKDIYLNRSSQLPDGQRAVAFELPPGNHMRDEFHRLVTGRTDPQLKAFRSRQVLTGKGRPPEEVSSANGMKSVVTSTLGSIGYLDSTLVDETVKVILSPASGEPATP